MTVNFYYCGDDPATLSKGLNLIGSYNCQIKENSSLLTPTIILRTSEWKTMNTSSPVNYCQIADTSFGNRYYFIKNPTITTGNRIELDLNVDVLQSNRTELMECEAYVQRSGNISDWNRYLPDPLIPIKTTTRVINLPFDSTPFEVIDSSATGSNMFFNYLLTVVGGEN